MFLNIGFDHASSKHERREMDGMRQEEGRERVGVMQILGGGQLRHLSLAALKSLHVLLCFLGMSSHVILPEYRIFPGHAGQL